MIADFVRPASAIREKSTISKPCCALSGNLAFTIRAECRASQAETRPGHARDLTLAPGLLPVILATIEFKTALETDVCSCSSGFRHRKGTRRNKMRLRHELQTARRRWP
jgi:hypothetical protein